MRALALLVVAACSTPKHEPDHPAPPVRPENHCAAVADRLLAAFAEIEKHPPEPALATAYKDVVVERCTQDVWSADAQRCMLEAGTGLDACAQQLTPEQRASFAEAAQARLNTAGTTAKP